MKYISKRVSKIVIGNCSQTYGVNNMSIEMIEVEEFNQGTQIKN